MEKLKTGLILDRDRDITDEIASLLRRNFKGCSVLQANTPEDGIKIAKENPIDLVIMDLFLVDGIKYSRDPKELPMTVVFRQDALHGDAIVEEIKKYRPEAKIVIYSTESPYDGPFTSTHQHAAAIRVLDLGIDGFLQKVSAPSAFIQMVEKLCNIKASEKLDL